MEEVLGVLGLEAAAHGVEERHTGQVVRRVERGVEGVGQGGAARGVGRAAVALLHARGARVVAVDLRPDITALPDAYPADGGFTAV